MRVQRRVAAVAVALGVALSGALFVPATPARAVPVPVGTSTTSTFNSISPKSDVASCPTGQVVFDGGGYTSGFPGEVVVTDVVLGLNTVRVDAEEVGPYSGNWSVTAWAVCGEDDDEELVITYATGTGTAASKVAVASCPAGKKLYGTGYELLGANGQVFPSAVRPDAALSQVTVRADAHGGFTGGWSLVAYGVCGKPAAYMRLVTARSALDSAASKTVTTEACPGDSNVHGAGAEISGGFGDVALVREAPSSDALIAAEAGASEYAPVSGDWTVVSYAICSS